MKRHLIAVLIVVVALVAGALGLLGHHFDDMSRAVDTWLTEAGYKLQTEPIGPEEATTQIAEAALPITMIAAGGLVLILIWLVLRELRKAVADHVPRSRIRRRKRRIARGDPAGTASLVMGV